jgi:Ca-activated chloride channel family protein
VSKGLAEVRKFKVRNRVNRVILLSDGMANVGPSNPSELAALGKSAGRSGVGVTTIGLGLGYNEDLMSQLAMASDGNHAFVENSGDLARIFEQEIGGVLSVVAQSVEIDIYCPAGVRPIRILDQDAEIRGQKVHLNYNQIYGRQNKTLLLEVEVKGKKQGQSMDLASVQINYDDPTSGRKQQLNQSAQVSFTASEEVVRREVYKPAVVEAAKAKSNIASKLALELRDKGDFLGAGAVMQQSADDMKKQAKDLNIPELEQQSDEAKAEASVLSAPASAQELNKSRKELKAKQYERSSKFSIQKK